MNRCSSAFFARRSLVIALIMGFVWCVFMFALYLRALTDKAENTERLALMQTRTLYTMITDARYWNSTHGGVYVPESDYGRPNPYIPERQRSVTTTDGQRLVMMNPAYMSRQIADISAGKGASFRITSHAPLRPENASDPWESAALAAFVQGHGELFRLMETDDGLYYRYIAPLRTEHACLACHKANSEGDVRGGISVKLDARPFLEEALQHENSLGWAFLFMGLTGFFGIGGVSLAMDRRRFLAEEANRIKSSFLANMSHDMRTPLAGILGMSELIPEAESREEREGLARRLEASGHALMDMLTDLSEHALLDAGRVTLACHVFRPSDVLGECLALITPACRVKNLRLDLDIAPDVPFELCGDPFRLRQALGNLVSNAVKFTDQGSVRVTAKIEPGAPGKIGLCLEVADTGPGIDVHGEDKKIFERFERGKAAQERKKPGTGLGLSLAREIARMMGGDVTVRPNPGGGAVFSLRAIFETSCGSNAAEAPSLKNDARSCAEHGQDRASAAKARAALEDMLPCEAVVSQLSDQPYARPLRVLVAEDNTVNAHFMSEVLGRAGHIVELATNGAEAVRLLHDHRPDALFLDLRMPGFDGFTLLGMIRRGETAASADLPVFVLSASLGNADCARLDALGVSGRFLKPLRGRDLLELLQSVGRNVSKQAGFGHAASAALPVYDRVAALDAMDGREDILQRMGTIFCADLPEKVGELEAAAGKKDAREVLRLAHAIKNSAAALYFMRLKAAAATAEESAGRGIADRVAIARLTDEAEAALIQFNANTFHKVSL